MAVGDVECTTFDDNHTNTYWSEFHAAVSGCSAIIRAKLRLDDPERDVDYYEYAYQGSNSTLLIRYRDDLLVTNVTAYNLGVTNTITFKEPQRPANQATVMVRPNALPPYGFEHLTTVWLALCAGCYYSEASQTAVSPAVFVGHGFREAGLKVKSNWILNEELPHALRFMAEFSDGNDYEIGGKEIKVKPLPIPFASGYTNAVFHTTEWTNIAGLNIPTRFELLKYSPDMQNARPAGLRLAYKMVGRLQSVVAGTTNTSFTSVLPARTRVVDYTHDDDRLSTKYFTYYSKGGQLLPYEEVLKRRDEIQASVVRKSRPKRLVIVLAFCAICVLPLVVIFSRRKAAPTHSEKM